MTTTPLMSLVLPTDHGSSGTWDVILDTVFGLVDGHDHTTGKGAQVPMSGLKVGADLSFSFGGVSRSITDLKAIDFSPQASSGMVALAGALFLDSADNELYYRTTGGTNVKITSGTTLNVAGFAGGIGGDYAGVGALVEFTDSIDSYKFEQQVGASVRQFARMQSADVDLFEYKAHPTAGVPTTRVRLQSPAALAASYAVTFPGAVPSTNAFVRMSSSGVLTALTQGVRWHHVGQSTGTVQNAGGGLAVVVPTTASIWFPLTVNVGETISAWSAAVQKNSNASVTVSAQLLEQDASAATVTQIGATQSNAANAPGNISLGQSGLTTTAAAGKTYAIIVFNTSGAGEGVYGYSVTV